MSLQPNELLKSAVETSGLTYGALAAAVRAVAADNGETLRTNKSTVQHWISGTRPAGRTGWYLTQALSRRLRRALTEADLGLAPPTAHDGQSRDPSFGLSLDTDPIRALLPMWRAELDRRSFLTASAYSAAAAMLPLTQVKEIAGRAAHAHTGKAVGGADVAAARDMVSMFTTMDERHGGQHGRSALISYLRDDLAPMCRGSFSTEQAQSEMLMVASRAVHLAGFKAYDAGQHGLAQRYYLQAFSLATESDVVGADAHVLRTMALQGLKRNRPEECVALAETALSRLKRADPLTEATFRCVLAHAYAEAGRNSAAAAEVKRTDELMATPQSPEDIPFWALAWGPPAGMVHARIARVFKALGDPTNAAGRFARAAASRPDQTYARVNALNLADGARMRLKQGHIEKACAEWDRSLGLMAGVRSTRTRKAITQMRQELAAFRDRGVKAAAALDNRAAAILAND
jgi:hypothetical protein